MASITNTLTMTAHLYGARGLYTNRAQLSSLSPDVARAAIEFQRNAAASYEAELQARFDGEGRVVVDLSVAERQAFADAASDVITEARAGQPALDYL